MGRWSRWWIVVPVVVAGILLTGWAGVRTGLVNVGADEPHWPATAALLEWVRDGSVAARSAVLEAPDLADLALIRDGAGHYGSMCEGCHLAPGIADTELRAGLNPRPPALAEPGRDRTAAADFWIVKHGLRMTGMPAWGASHDDRGLWALVAFVRQLPAMSGDDYRVMTGRAAREPGHGDHAGGGAEPGDQPVAHEHDAAGHQGCSAEPNCRFGDTRTQPAGEPADHEPAPGDHVHGH